MSSGAQVQDAELTAEASQAVVSGEEKRPAFRLRAIMRQGTAASLPGAWEHYRTIEDARAGTRPMYHDDRVLRVMIVTDGLPSRFVEWVER
jgi:hypothetical protein